MPSLPNVGLILAPYLEKGNGKEGDAVTFERPAEARQIAVSRARAGRHDRAGARHQGHARWPTIITSSTTRFPRWWPTAGPAEVQERFFRTIREELSAEVHGEVDEKSWHLKQALLRRQTNVRKETKLFREYARQAFEDTLTLYLHGTCCDIDVETGPRQMPSRYLRRRLELLVSLFPPPEGYAVLPEQLKAR